MKIDERRRVFRRRDDGVNRLEAGKAGIGVSKCFCMGVVGGGSMFSLSSQASCRVGEDIFLK